MDRSECKRIVERELDALTRALGIPHWRLVISYEPVGEATTAGWRPLAKCVSKPEYERAVITIDPAGFDDDEESELLGTLRHELMHVVLASYGLYRSFATAFIKAGDPADSQEDSVWRHADELAVRNLERLWHGAEGYWRERIATEAEVMPSKKAGKSTPKVEKMYKGMVKRGMPKGKAAAISQSATGQSLATGRKAKTHDGKPVRRARKKSK